MRAALACVVATAAVAGVLVPSGSAVANVTLGYVGAPAGGCGTDDIAQLLSDSPSYTLPSSSARNP